MLARFLLLACLGGATVESFSPLSGPIIAPLLAHGRGHVFPSTRQQEYSVSGSLLLRRPLTPLTIGSRSRGARRRESCSITDVRCQAVSDSNIREKVNFYNTLTRDKQPFVPLSKGKVKMYTCGPTVYDFAHIGNFRAFLTYDLIKRWLLYCGFEVDHICNLTDVDDKIIQRMKRDSIGLKDLTNKFSGTLGNRTPLSPAQVHTEWSDQICCLPQMPS